MEHKLIPLSVPNLNGNEIKYVTKALKDGWVSTAGPYIGEFEKEIAQYVKVDGAVACQSGTSGIHIALLSAGVMSEDIILVPTLTFIAAVNPVRYIGATPVFMDCDDSLCIDPNKLEQYLNEKCILEEDKTVEKATGKQVKAIMVVHVFGNMADMVSIMKIASKFHLLVIEDATEALGTYYENGTYAGKFAGTIGDIGVYSFNGNKIITTGGGGMIVSENRTYLKKAKHLTTQAKEDALYYLHDEIGYNYRMTCLQAALGIAQIEQLEKFIKIKKQNYEIYQELLGQVEDLELLSFREGVRSNYWFYGLNSYEFQAGRDEIINYLIQNNIQARPIWGLIHKQRPYQNSMTYRINKAEFFCENVVNIPCSTSLTFEEIKQVTNKLQKLIYK